MTRLGVLSYHWMLFCFIPDINSTVCSDTCGVWWCALKQLSMAESSVLYEGGKKKKKQCSKWIHVCIWCVLPFGISGLSPSGASEWALELISPRWVHSRTHFPLQKQRSLQVNEYLTMQDIHGGPHITIWLEPSQCESCDLILICTSRTRSVCTFYHFYH